jgi:phage/plasmid-like protein (TIGR03299 family)
MSHEIEAMAYHGAVPWHGLGARLAEFASSAEMQAAAGLAWTVGKREAYFADGAGGFVRVPERFALVRETDGKPLGAVVSGEYQAFQPGEMFAFGDALTSTGAARWETAGSLRGGARIWAIAQVAGHFDVRTLADGKPDRILPFLLLYNTFDGTSSFRARFTTVRVVCANTARLALGGKADAGEARIQHRGDLAAKVGEAQRLLGLASKSFETQSKVAAALESKPFDRTEMATFAAQMLTGEDSPAEAVRKFREADGRSETRYRALGAELAWLYARGDGNRGETAWDALNAVTEYVDRQRARAGNWRSRRSRTLSEAGLDSALFGAGERMKLRAVRLLADGTEIETEAEAPAADLGGAPDGAAMLESILN